MSGLVPVSARYDITVPVPPPDVPFTLERPMRQEVPANGHDRFLLIVGAAERSDEDGPWIYLADVELEHDQGETTTIKSVALIDAEPARSAGWPWPTTDGS